MNQITLEIGYGLIPLVDPDKGAKLLDNISHLKKKIKEEHGDEIPKVHIKDNSDLKSREYRIVLSDVFNGTISQKRMKVCFCTILRTKLRYPPVDLSVGRFIPIFGRSFALIATIVFVQEKTNV